MFRLHQVFVHAAEAFAEIDIEITKSLPDEIIKSKYRSFANDGGDVIFGIASKINALDFHSARLVAEKRVKLCATLISLFHHKECPTWLPECIVIDEEENFSKLIHTPINSMHKCRDLTPPAAGKTLRLFMKEFSLDKNSFAKFVSSAQLHSMALRSDAEENQILNLWISLESLVPSETKADDASNIEHIVESIVPFLNIEYFERLLLNLARDLLRWNSPATKRALRPVPGQRLPDKLVKLLVLSEFDSERLVLEGEFKDFHLLRDRFNYFRGVLSSPAQAVKALDAHRLRLQWQLRRIYRARNIIVHSGRTPQYTRALIEHAHDYLDSVLSTLVKLASLPKTVNSVAQGFKYVELKYGAYYKSLDTKGLVFDADNIEALVLTR